MIYWYPIFRWFQFKSARFL